VLHALPCAAYGKHSFAPVSREILQIGVYNRPIKWTGLRFDLDASSASFIEGDHVQGTVAADLKTVSVNASNVYKGTSAMVTEKTTVNCKSIPYDEYGGGDNRTPGSEELTFEIDRSTPGAAGGLTNVSYPAYLDLLSYSQEYPDAKNNTSYVSTNWDDVTEYPRIWVTFTARNN
jgi:hypothetical protein